MKKILPTLVMVGGGVQHVEAVKIIQSSGYKVLTTDRNPDALCLNDSDFYYICDGKDSVRISNYIMKNKKKMNIQGIFTLTELVETVAEVGKLTGLPSVFPKSAKLCQNKKESKNIWLSKGVPTPKGISVTNLNEAKKFLEENDYNCFVKPIVGFGGIGAKKIISNEQLVDYYHKYKKNSFIIEEHLKGQFIDLNGYFNEKGNFFLLGCFDRYFCKNKTIEKYGIYPSKMPKSIIDQAKKITSSAAKALGINWGPIKSDLILTDSGLKILEIAPRLHGPKGSLFLTSISGGTNHLSFILPLLIGAEIDYKKFIKPKYKSSFALIEPPKKPFSEIDFSNIIKDTEYIMKFKDSSKKIIKYDDSLDVIGYFFSRSPKNVNLIEKNKIISKKIIFNE